MAALAATGALIVGGSAVAMVGSGNADPLVPLPVPVVGTTYVLPDLAPFQRGDIREGGEVEVSDAFGAPDGGGDAALRLRTPGTLDKAAIGVPVTPNTPLAAWIETAAYSAYRSTGGDPVQFPSMQLTIDFDPTSDAGFSTLTYEPVYNPDDETAAGEWHRYEAGSGNWCSTRAIPDVISDDQKNCSVGGAKPLSDYITAQPDIVVTGVVLNQGSGNPGQEGAVDLVSTPSTTYDFELTEPAVTPDPDPCEEPSVPTLPTEEPSHPSQPDEGQNGGGHEDGGNNAGHEDGGHEDGGQEQPEPQPEPEPCS
jgi:hypothetical protein